MRETSLGCLSYRPAAQAQDLIRIRAGDLSLCGTKPNQLNYTGQGTVYFKLFWRTILGISYKLSKAHCFCLKAHCWVSGGKKSDNQQESSSHWNNKILHLGSPWQPGPQLIFPPDPAPCRAKSPPACETNVLVLL